MISQAASRRISVYVMAPAMWTGSSSRMVMLLHAVSKTNAAVLDSVLKDLKGQGYVFKLLPQ